VAVGMLEPSPTMISRVAAVLTATCRGDRGGADVILDTCSLWVARFEWVIGTCARLVVDQSCCSPRSPEVAGETENRSFSPMLVVMGQQGIQKAV
jgi:hypothetical protein